MNESCDLNKRKCEPCHGGVPPLNPDMINKLLTQLGLKWSINKLGHLAKKFEFDNFLDAMNFANKISEIAENENHHPDLYISYGQCSVEIWTHKINSLTESDFVLAAKINDIINT